MKLNDVVKFLLSAFISIFIYFECNIVFASQSEMLSNGGSQLDFSKVTYIQSEKEPDSELEEAFSKAYGLKRGEDKVRYYYNRIDLNGDGKPETFVYLTGPMVCGTGGCSALIFQKADGQYKIVSRFSLVRTPIIIRDQMTNGWKNIIMYVSGGGMEGRYKELIFNEGTYPLNPSIQPNVKNGKIKGTGLFSGDLSGNPGIEF